VKSAPRPPVSRARAQESPHRGFHPDIFDRIDQPLRPAVQPVDRLLGVARRLAILDRARVEVTVAAIRDDLRGPAITATDVPQQVGKTPARTRRYRGRRFAATDQFAEGAVLL